MPPKTQAQAGIITVLIAILLSWGTAYWLKTRIFTPVDIPVSLELGKIQTVEFRINLPESYSVRIDVNYSIDDWTSGKCSSMSLWDTDWKVYRLGGGTAKKSELWASSNEIRQQGFLPDGFRATPGKYLLEWTAPAGATCLNARHPRLRIFTSSDEYEQVGSFIWYACLFLGGGGVMLVLRALGSWLLANAAKKRSLKMFPDVLARNVIPLQRHHPARLLTDLPNFGLVLGCILYILVFIFMMVSSRSRWTSHGLLVDIRKPNVAAWQESPWTETLGVYVDAQGQFYLNGRPVARRELQSKLQQELGRRVVWTVYFEADDNCSFMDAIYAMDTIRGAGAKVAWITPRIREELNRTPAH